MHVLYMYNIREGLRKTDLKLVLASREVAIVLGTVYIYSILTHLNTSEGGGGDQRSVQRLEKGLQHKNDKLFFNDG